MASIEDSLKREAEVEPVKLFDDGHGFHAGENYERRGRLAVRFRFWGGRRLDRAAGRQLEERRDGGRFGKFGVYDGKRSGDGVVPVESQLRGLFRVPHAEASSRLSVVPGGRQGAGFHQWRDGLDEPENGRKVWECYVLGLDPENATNDFRITSFPMKADGAPDLSGLTFEPPKEKWNVSGAMPVLKGAKSLDGPWAEVPKNVDPALRFFKIEVELP